MSITSVVNDLVTSVSVINALKPLPPTISGYSVGGVDDTALDPAGGQTVQINGTGFLAGATITFDGSAVAVVTYVNPNRLTFTSPAKTAGTYTIYAVNPDGGTAIFIPGIIYSVLPTWTTSAGTLGSYYETTSISNTVIATGDAPITYSLFSGSLPAGSTLSSSGVITGTAPVDGSSTTYSFTIQATDAQLQDSTRSFSLTINVDAVTWVSPANATTYTSAVNSAISNVALSATDAAGYNVSYSANALPTGLSLSGANISGTPTVIADSSTLLTATAATTNRSATRTINWSITVANDTYFEYNTLLIPGASTTFVDDASTNNFAVTIFGDTKPNSFNPYSPGYYSNYITTGAYLTTPATVANSGFSTGDFTVEAWIYPTVAQSTTIVSSNYSYSTAAGNWAFYTTVGSANTVYFNGGSSSSPSANHASTATATIPLNQWTHIAYSRTSAVGYFFINGVQLGTGVADTSGYAGATGTLYVGRQADGTGYLTGYISNLRIVKGTGVYTASFTPSTTPLTAISGTSLLTCQSNRFIDNSSNAYTLTITGSPTINSFQPFTPNSSYSTYGSGYFDGTGDYLTVPGNSVFAFGTGDFTLEVWLYANSISTGTFDRICATSDYNGSGFDWTLNTSTSSLYVVGTAYSIGSITPKVWHHLVYTRSGSVIRGFLNGNLSSYTTGASQNVSSVSQLNIGVGYSGTYLNGYLVDLRIIKGSIPAGYQTSSTTTGTQIFTPPTAPLTAIANTSLLVLQNNQSVNNSVFLDNSSNNFLVTRAGNTTQGTFSPYGGNWSNYFDGTGDRLSIASNALLALGTGDFTIEMWVYNQSTTNRLISWGVTTSPIVFINSSNQLVYENYGVGVLQTSTSTISLNTWAHVAVSRNTGVTRMYINGVVANSTPLSDTNNWGQSGLYIGVDVATTYMTGFISNLRVLKGTGLYPNGTTFTPSTTPLTSITNTLLLTCQSPRFIDNSINNFTITKAGDTSVQRFSPFNPSSVTATSYSGYFDGTGDYLTVPANAAFAPGTGNFTIEGWYYSTAASGNQQMWAQTVGGSDYFVVMFTPATSQFRFLGNGVDAFSTAIANPNTWNHFAVVRVGTSVTVYCNGIGGTPVTFADNFTNTTYVPTISGYTHSATNMLTGYLSNLRYVKGVAVYTGAFTVPTSPLAATQSSGTNIAAITGTSTSLLTCQSTTFIDNSTNNFTISAFGNSQPSIQNPFGYTSTTTNGYTVSTIGGSGYFDGTGDYLTAPTNNVFSLSAAFTFETWLYPTAFSSYKGIWSNTNTINSTGLHVGLNSAGNIFIYSNSSFVVTSSNAMTLNAWNHVAVVRNSGIVYIYINGVVSTNSWTTSTAFTNAACVIGTNPGPGTEYYFGYLSDARLLNGTALYTSNFVPPSAPLTAVQNTSILTNMTSAGIYDASTINVMETVGDAKLSTAVSKFGGSSMYFDGAADKLFIPYNAVLSFGTGDFTVEFWAYWDSPVADAGFVGSISAGGMDFAYTASSLRIGRVNTAWDSTFSSWTPTASVWYHIAFTRNNGTARAFVNGVQIGSNSSNTISYEPTGGMNIGISNLTDRNFKGYLDDLRITKGYARYTSNFTAPTSAFPIY